MKLEAIDASTVRLAVKLYLSLAYPGALVILHQRFELVAQAGPKLSCDPTRAGALVPGVPGLRREHRNLLGISEGQRLPDVLDVGVLEVRGSTMIGEGVLQLSEQLERCEVGASNKHRRLRASRNHVQRKSAPCPLPPCSATTSGSASPGE